MQARVVEPALRPGRSRGGAAEVEKSGTSPKDLESARSMRSVERVAGVLATFTTGEQVLGVTEIARRLSLPKSAVHRILDALVRAGLVAREPLSSGYRLGFAALQVGLAAMGTSDPRVVALPVMQDLVDRTAETATLSVLVGLERTYLAEIEGPQVVRMTVGLGGRQPLYAGASGRAILAYFSEEELSAYLSTVQLRALTEATPTRQPDLLAALERVRDLGYASSVGERDPSAAAVAAPIFASGRRVMGSVSICGPQSRFLPSVVRSHGQAVAEASRIISAAL